MVVAASDQCRTGRRTKRRRVELGVAKPFIRDTIHCRGWNDAAEGPGNAVALVVRHDEKHVRCSFGRHDSRWPPGFRFGSALFNDTSKFWRLCRQLVALDAQS